MIYLLLISIFSLAQLFLQQTYAQDGEEQLFKDTLQLQEFACNAHDPASLKECIKEIRRTGTPLIKIIQPIICESRAECEFDLSNISSSVTIRASKPEYKILRKNDYGYTLFKAENTAGLHFLDMTIEDESENPCEAGVICPPVLILKNTDSMTFKDTTFNKTHGTTISAADSRNLTIINSNFLNSQKNALEISSQLFSEGMDIEKSTFEGNAGQAIIFQSQNLEQNPSLITLNKFINNHAKGAYASCVYPCVGSQIKISGPTSNLSFSRNVVSGGPDTFFDVAGLYSSGIEVGNRDISKISLLCNQISGNRGSGIVQSPPFSNLSEINISANKIWNNGLNLNIPVATIATDNCYAESCQQACF